MIYIVEGEKDVDSARRYGAVATCNAGGAGKWTDEHSEVFRGTKADVAIVIDLDAAGRRHGLAVHASLLRVGVEAKILEPKAGGDLTDHLMTGHKLEDLVPIEVGDLETKEEEERSKFPRILCSHRQLSEIISDTADAVALSNEPAVIFRFGDAPARVLQSVGFAPRILVMRTDDLWRQMTTSADFFRVNTRGEEVPTNPPRNWSGLLAAEIAARPAPFPELEGLTEFPVLRVDGSIQEAPGYDPKTRLFYSTDSTFALRSIQKEPRHSDIGAAAGTLGHLLLDFPFVSSADRANALAALITPVLRPLIGGPVPLFLVSAPTPGTGKSLFADVIGIVANGRGAALMPEPGDRGDAEYRKRITSILMKGEGLVVIDNVEGTIGSPALSAALTAPLWEDRVLGVSQMVTVPQRTTFIVNGNNVVLGGDMLRRTIPILMDAQVDRPWTRRESQFKHADLRAYTKTKRQELLAAILTLGRAWIQKGSPEPRYGVPSLGSFEEWRRIVGGVLEVAGVGDFLGSQEDFYEAADDEGSAFAAFLEGWYTRHQDTLVTVSQFRRAATADFQITNGIDFDALAVSRGDWDLDQAGPLPAGLQWNDRNFAMKLGMMLEKKRERRYRTTEPGPGSLRIVSGGKSKGARRWSVVHDPDTREP